MNTSVFRSVFGRVALVASFLLVVSCVSEDESIAPAPEAVEAPQSAEQALVQPTLVVKANATEVVEGDEVTLTIRAASASLIDGLTVAGEALALPKSGTPTIMLTHTLTVDYNDEAVEIVFTDADGNTVAQTVRFQITLIDENDIMEVVRHEAVFSDFAENALAVHEYHRQLPGHKKDLAYTLYDERFEPNGQYLTVVVWESEQARQDAQEPTGDLEPVYYNSRALDRFSTEAAPFYQLYASSDFANDPLNLDRHFFEFRLGTQKADFREAKAAYFQHWAPLAQVVSDYEFATADGRTFGLTDYMSLATYQAALTTVDNLPYAQRLQADYLAAFEGQTFYGARLN